MAEKTAEELAAEKAAADAAAEAEKNKVKFDAAQAEFVNKLYNRAHGEAKEKADKEWATKLAAEKAELARVAAEEKAALEAQLEELKKLTAQKPEEKPVELPKIEEHPLFKQMQAQYQEINGIFKSVKDERDALKANQEKAEKERIKSRKKDQFLGALSDAKVTFFDPLEAYELAEREGLEFDPTRDTVFVKNPATGLPKLNGNGEPMNAVDFVKEFAARKKYLVKAATQEGGIGSTSSSELPKKEKTEEKDWSKVSKEEFDAEVQRLLSLSR